MSKKNKKLERKSKFYNFVYNIIKEDEEEDVIYSDDNGILSGFDFSGGKNNTMYTSDELNNMSKEELIKLNQRLQYHLMSNEETHQLKLQELVDRIHQEEYEKRNNKESIYTCVQALAICIPFIRVVFDIYGNNISLNSIWKYYDDVNIPYEIRNILDTYGSVEVRSYIITLILMIISVGTLKYTHDELNKLYGTTPEYKEYKKMQKRLVRQSRKNKNVVKK